MRRAARRLAAALALAAPALLGAQGPGVAVMPAPACLDAIPASALHPAVAYLVSRYADSLDPARGTLVPIIDNLTQGIAFRVRAMLDTSTTRLPAGEPAVSWRDLSGRVEVVWHPDGRMRWRAVPNPDASFALGTGATALILRALEQMRADGEQLVVPDSSRHDSVSFHLAYRVPEVREDGTVAPLTLRAGVPVFSVRVPWSEEVHAVPRQPGPRYPQRLLQRGIGGVVQARFVVDAAGRLVPGSFTASYPPDRVPPQGSEVEAWRELATAVEQAVPRMKFTPARLGGCEVPQLVLQPFTFAISGR